MSIVEKFGLWTFAIGIVLVLLWNVLAGGLSGLPALIAVGGLVYWLVGLVLFRLFKLSIRNLWQGIACGFPVVVLFGYLIHFYTYDGVPKKYLIRESYRGRITIVYNHPQGMTPATQGDTTIFVIPPNGLLLVDIAYETTDFGRSSFYFMGIGDSTRRKIPKHYLHLGDSTSVQVILGSITSFKDYDKNYKTEFFYIDIHDNNYWNRRENITGKDTES